MPKLHRTSVGPRFLPFSVTLGLALLARPAEGQVTERVSVDPSGAQANSGSTLSALSADGRVVAFWSVASNLVPGDTNDAWDIFIKDRDTGSIERLPMGMVPVGGWANLTYLLLSADGSLLCFTTDLALVPADTNGKQDAYVHDRATASYELASVDSAGALGNDFSYADSISADGQVVLFHSGATNLVVGDTNATGDVFVHDRSTGVTELVSVSSSGVQGNDSSYSHLNSLSADGQIVGFSSRASNLVPGDTNLEIDSFVRDRVAGTTERVSVDSSGGQGNNDSGGAMLSADGQIVVFESASSNLVAGDTNDLYDIFARDRSTGITERVSVDSAGLQSASGGMGPTISADGRLVAFSSFDALVPADTNGAFDLFLHDRETGVTSRASVDSSGAQADSYVNFGSISSDGLNVVFESFATNLVANDTNWTTDIFVHELCSIDASWVNYGTGFPGTLGVPGFTSRAVPKLGTTITLDVGNSAGATTMGFLFVGSSRASIPFKQGTLLVGSVFLVQPLSIAGGGLTFDVEIPNDAALGGLLYDAQMLELDAGAAKGVSFSAGLELVLGR